MKKLLLLTLIILFTLSCATTLPPAEETSEEIKQADTIMIYYDMEPEQAYKDIANHLIDNGYELQNTDESLMNITTGYKPNDGNLSYSTKLNVSVRSDYIRLSGKVKNNMLGESQIENKGMGGSINEESWSDMKEIAVGFNHSKITYKRN